MVAALLCHDAIEDGYLGGDKINKEFLAGQLGERAAFLVDGITELGKEPGYVGEKPSKEYILAKLFEAAKRDPLVLIAKICDRKDNMQTLAYVKSETARKKAAETLYVFCPLLNYLGMWEEKRILEDLAFQYINPERYQEIKKVRDTLAKNNQKKIDETISNLPKVTVLLGVSVTAELRGVYELHQRLELRKKCLGDLDIDDIWRVNMIVPKEPLIPGAPGCNCYLALGALHRSYQPAQNHRLEDHIFEACPNGHRFLHTYVKVDGFGDLLVQIRDEEMYEEYRLGILAKTQGTRDWGKIKKVWLDSLIRSLTVEYQLKPEEIEGLIAALSAPVKVRSLKTNEVYELPRGATLLDFAFKVLGARAGLRAIDAKVEGRSHILLSYVLEDGDSVWINCDRGSHIKLEWLEWVQIPEVRMLIVSALRSLPDPWFEKLAAKFMGGELAKYYLPVKSFTSSQYFLKYLDKKGFAGYQDFLGKLRTGEVRDVAALIAECLGEYNQLLTAKKYGAKLIGYKIIGEDKPGLEDAITGRLFAMGLNINKHVSFNMPVNGQNKGVIYIVVDGLDGDCREIQKMQFEEMIRSAFGSGVISFSQLRDIEIKTVQNATDALKDINP